MAGAARSPPVATSSAATNQRPVRPRIFKPASIGTVSLATSPTRRE
jgi:hypothetical protein